MSGSKNNRVYTFFDTQGLESALREASGEALARGAIRIRDRARKSLKPGPRAVDANDLKKMLPAALRPFFNLDPKALLLKALELNVAPGLVLSALRKTGTPKQIIAQAMANAGITDAQLAHLPRRLKRGKQKQKVRGEPSAPGTPPHSQSGTLKRSIVAEQNKQTGGVRVGLAADGWYGRVHEFGGRRHPKRPFLKPALDKETPRLPEEFRNADLASTRAGKKMNRRKAPFDVD